MSWCLPPSEGYKMNYRWSPKLVEPQRVPAQHRQSTVRQLNSHRDRHSHHKPIRWMSLCRWFGLEKNRLLTYPDSKVHGAHMGPIWGRQDPDGPHVGPMNFAILGKDRYCTWQQFYTFIRIKNTFKHHFEHLNTLEHENVENWLKAPKCSKVVYESDSSTAKVYGRKIRTDLEKNDFVPFQLHQSLHINRSEAIGFYPDKLDDSHYDVIKWKHFARYWPFVRGIYQSPVNSPHKGQWRGALMFSLICAWMIDWVNNREAGDLRRHRAHYDVIVMDINVNVMAADASTISIFRNDRDIFMLPEINSRQVLRLTYPPYAVVNIIEIKTNDSETQQDDCQNGADGCECHWSHHLKSPPEKVYSIWKLTRKLCVCMYVIRISYI